MVRIRLEWHPKTCAYCDNPIVCTIRKNTFLKITEIMVCEECAKEIWGEETSRRLP